MAAELLQTLLLLHREIVRGRAVSDEANTELHGTCVDTVVVRNARDSSVGGILANSSEQLVAKFEHVRIEAAERQI
jgi:hypothetical protein